MKLIVGLGNPGKQYEKTRHNVGFMTLDKIASDFKFVKKFNAEIAVRERAAVICGETILAKPQTFMNLSGQSVRAIISFYKINTKDLIVVHDDLDIQLGEFKIQKNRSSAGHNGAQSIIDLLGTKDFTRIRIGIKNERPNIVTEKFVLEKFSKEEMEIIDEIIKKVSDTLMACRTPF